MTTRAPAASAALPPLHRHDIVILQRATPGRVLRASDACARAAVLEWIAAQRPFVVTQQQAAAAGWLALGLALPPAPHKQRIALAVPHAFVEHIGPAPRLRDVVARVPAAHRAAPASLAMMSDAIGMPLRVFGSLAWQALTGLPYAAAASDVDVCWRPPNRAALHDGLVLLERWEADSNRRADCEIEFPAGGAVAWREWAGRAAHSRVLVKQLGGTAMLDAGDLLRAFDDDARDACASY